MTVHALPGTATLAACSQLFSRYPLAITPQPANGGSRSMVLMNRAAWPPAFSVLTQAAADRFALRSWNHRDGVNQEIRPGQPVSALIGQLITSSMPVPHDGALLGWLTDSQVTALLVVHCQPPELWNPPVADPGIQVMPLAGTSELLHWPPFTTSPLDDGRLWDYIERGQIVDIASLLTHSAGRAFWVPSRDRRSTRHEQGCIVITGNRPAEEYWLPAGVYLDHWTLREGIPAPPVGHLLIQPDAVDLTRKRR